MLLFDNGSVDGSVEYLKRRHGEVSIYEMGRNTGFSLPNNEGIRKAEGEYILTLNTDVVIEPDFIAEMVNAIETDPRVGWVAGKMLKLTREGVKRDEIDCLGHHMARFRYATETDYSVPFGWEYYSTLRPVFGALGHRSGHGKPRRLTLGCGTITVRRPRVRGTGAAV